MNNTPFHLAPMGESALVFSLNPPANLEQQRLLWAFSDVLQTHEQIVETVVGMNNLTIFLLPSASLDEMRQQIAPLWQSVTAQHHQGKLVEIPVVYGGEWGQDLAEVAAYHGISCQEVVQRHTEPTYTVFMMGFQPGFPYLGGLPAHLHTPRRAVPRKAVPAGSVGIGGAQTGIYPFSSPGGWQIIGQTNLPLFCADQNPPTVLNAGDTVRFVAERVVL